MKKRALAALLWFYAGWYAGAIVAFYVGLPDAIGPLVGWGKLERKATVDTAAA